MAIQPPRKILIGMDGGPYSFNAYDWFKSYFLKDRDDVYLFFCTEPPEPQRRFSLFQSSSKSKQQAEKRRSSTLESTADFTQTLEQLINQAGFKGSVIHVESAKPGEAIVKAAEERKIDIIIVGSHGKSSLKRTLVGSTSHYVMHNTNIPTVICQLPDPVST